MSENAKIVQMQMRGCALCFKDELNAFCEERQGVSLEGLQYRLEQIGKAEMGKLTFVDGKAGKASVSRGCKSVTVNGRKIAEVPAGAHPSIGFWREQQAATAYSQEFEGVIIPLSQASREWVEGVCEKLEQEALAKKEEAKAKKEGVAP